MQVFHCQHCRHLVFFENVQCVKCGHTLAYLPDMGLMSALEPEADALWRALARGDSQRYRLCENYRTHAVCNWAVRADDTALLCTSCRLTQVAPDPSQPDQRQAWQKLELAKRRVIYSLVQLGCPIVARADDPDHGLAYEFRGDADVPEGAVLTGHANGVITVSIAEADDAERERRRLQLHEPYRTLLGHFRHEVGHYYWDRLVKDGPHLERFRALFGDERADYGAALQAHYRDGPPADWQQRFVSAYAASHPWEDWAESWAHYLHMTDTLETAVANGLSLQPAGAEEPTFHAGQLDPQTATRPDPAQGAFERLIESWFPIAYVLNNLNRCLGMPDAYPFVLSTPAIDKLRLVHEIIREAAPGAGPSAPTPAPGPGATSPETPAPAAPA
jgi:hypothetical protein